MEFTKKAITSVGIDTQNFETDSFTCRFMGWFDRIRRNTPIRNSFIKIFGEEIDQRFTECQFRRSFKTDDLKEEVNNIKILIDRTLIESSAKFMTFLPIGLTSQEETFVERYYLNKLDTISNILNELTESW